MPIWSARSCTTWGDAPVMHRTELVAAEAEREVLGAKHGSQDRSDPAQHRVSAGVAEPVVDPFEVVDVDDHHGDRGLRGEAVAFVDEALVEGSAVAEPGQGVLHRPAYQTFVLALLAFAVDLRASGCEPTDPLVPALPGQAGRVGAGDRSDSRVARLLDQHRGPFGE